MDHNATIDKAKELLQPITFEPHYTGYYVTKNGYDQGGIQCENCIKDAVKDARKQHKQQRIDIKARFEFIIENGYEIIQGKKIKRNYPKADLVAEMRRRLREYPVKAKFDWESCDPDFAGGKSEPESCESCGQKFFTEFVPDEEELYYLENNISYAEIADVHKWELDMCFYMYKYCKPNIQHRLVAIAEKIIDQMQLT